MNKSPQYNQQSKSEVEEICIYQNTESGRHSINIYWVSKWVPCQKESQAIFIQQKAHLCLGPCCLDNTLKIKNSN